MLHKGVAHGSKISDKVPTRHDVLFETNKGSDALAKRSQLRAAVYACRKHGATLVITKLDRLAGNVQLVLGLMESKVKFAACDKPEATELTVQIMAAFAEHEAKRISQLTKDALTIATSYGVERSKASVANLSECPESSGPRRCLRQ